LEQNFLEQIPISLFMKSARLVGDFF